MRSAEMAAFFGDILRASSTETMYTVRAGAETVTAASAMVVDPLLRAAR
jgi:hypothetical protein